VGRVAIFALVPVAPGRSGFFAVATRTGGDNCACNVRRVAATTRLRMGRIYRPIARRARLFGVATRTRIGRSRCIRVRGVAGAALRVLCPSIGWGTEVDLGIVTFKAKGSGDYGRAMSGVTIDASPFVRRKIDDGVVTLVANAPRVLSCCCMG
jgi:hypothetical protein